ASLTAAATVTKTPAELLARRDGETLVVSVRQGGWPVAQTEVWVHTPGSDTPVSIRTDELGEARVTFPTGKIGGFVGVRALVKEAKPGEAGGKKYPAVHRWATLTFPNPAVPVATAANKPFSQILRASYANNHEVVGAAAFNKTLFDGKLTKEQLSTHLQQRALVHNEVHRILSGADPTKPVPYGAAQKNVLVLLADDLTALGSGVPTEAQARPLTKSFLQEIRESERNGPYFALGVQHVYYGGITNGGRMIGEKIGETLQFTPTYYAKSDGYQEYIAEVNKIADPKARAEMIRGGQAAYRYIIDSSNEEVFKAK
ncbi:MAG: hypothetical protein H7145_17870, partial [Akkermansiaceae bacterium]|nr:hypothetical protein [Armatimonadota bacterium]